MQSDSDLYHRWLEARDEQAFAALARRHANLVFDVAWRTGGDPHLAEDALQEALLRLATDGTSRPVEVGLRAWLARLAISKALNARASTRARRKREQKVGRERTEIGMTHEATGLQAEVAAALERCHRDDAALLSLRYLHGLPYGEVATVLGVAESTARVRVHRALRRVRKRVGRRETDERQLAGLLTAVPLHTPSAATLETAIAAAVDGTAAAALAAPTATVASWVPRALAVAGLTLLAAGSAGLLWWAAVTGRPGPAPTGTERAAAPEDAGSSTLRGRGVPVPGAAPSGASEKVAQPPMPVPGKIPPAPGPSSARPRDDGTIPLRARLLLVLDDGTEEAIAIEDIMHRGNTYPGTALAEYPDQVRVQPGGIVTLSTQDERAAFERVYANVPEPPTELVVRIPACGSFEDALALEVVDAETGAPIPDAWLEWGSGAGPGIRVPADRQGRIPVHIPDAACWADADRPVLWRFGCTEWVVHATGYRATGHVLGTKEYVPAVVADGLATWMQRGVRVVELTPWPRDGTTTTRTVRILLADGRPAVDAYVLVSWPVGRRARFGPWHDGFRRTDEDGEVEMAVHRVVGLDVRIDHVPVAAWGLAEARWPDEGPRVLQLPPLAEAELVVEGIPGNASYWRRDLLGPKRTPMDGPSFGAAYDPEARALLEEHDAVLFAVVGDRAGGRLTAPHTTMRLPLAVGQPSTLHLFAGHEHRTWTVQATEPGPFRETRSWDELPLAE